MKYKTYEDLEGLCLGGTFCGIPLGVLSAAFTPSEYDGTALVVGGIISGISLLSGIYFDIKKSEIYDNRIGKEPKLNYDSLNSRKEHYLWSKHKNEIDERLFGA